MPRLHLFEIEDQPWLPTYFRNVATGFLLVAHKVGKQNKLFTPKLESLIIKTGQRTIIDMGSGAGGPIRSIVEDLNNKGIDANAVLTDLYPNQKSVEIFANEASDRITYESSSVDATDMPVHLRGIRTMIASFHHLDEQTAQKVLLDAQSAHQPIAIFEGFGRNLAGFFILLPLIFLPCLFVPFIKPFKLLNLLFTYVLPLIPFLVFFDGWVSYLRIYSQKELAQLIEGLPSDDSYEWEIGSLGILKVPYLIGIPTLQNASMLH